MQLGLKDIEMRNIMQRKKYLAMLAAGTMLLGSLSGCGKKKDIETVHISLWADEQNYELVNTSLDNFKKEYEKDVKFDFTVSIEGSDTCKETVLSNQEGAADLFTFADDQFGELYRAGALLEITNNQDAVIEAVGGANSGAADAVTVNGKVYAYPKTSGNSYFLYYNKEYFSDEDVKTLDGILEVCRKNNKKFTMDYSSGWYIYSFFKGAGLNIEATEDGSSNECNWNATDTEYKGIDVAEAMINIAENEAFVSNSDDGFIQGVLSGEIIAGINGAWNAEKVSTAWGEGYAAVKLPTYTLAGNQVQMWSFSGYKMMGVNSHTKEPEWCMKLAEYLTNEDNQLKCFEVTGECPANIKVAANEKVQAAPAIAALVEQSKYGHVQRVAESYWQAASKLGIIFASGNLDGRDLQELLDEVQAEITGGSVEQ